MASEYTPAELMVSAAARQIRDGELVFVGMRLPLLAYLVARSNHAPSAVGLFENGIIRDSAAQGPFVTMGDPPNICNAIACGSMTDVMGHMQAGRVGLGLIGGAEVDVYGNVNSTWIKTGQKSIRLPGSGGAGDIASLAGRLVVLMTHQKRRFPQRVDYITSPGHGDGPGWRNEHGLTGTGPAAIITDLCVFRFNDQTSTAEVVSLHPGVDIEQVIENTGFEVVAAKDIKVTPRPTNRELKLIRTFDPNGFWTGR